MARKIQPRSKTPKPTPGQSSEDYWRERETRQRAANIHDEARFAARINDIFQSTQDSIQQEIESFYQRYARKEGIDVAEARRRVSKIDMEKYERLAAQYVKAAHEGGREAAFSDIANEQMRLYNATMRINRLEMLKARCGIRAMEGYRLADQLINDALEERTYSEYYRLAGILGNTVQFNENMVRSIVNASYQNATWSQRLWNNQALLSERIGAQIAQGILTGKGSDVLARNIQKLTGQSTFVCQRLMRTELRRVQTAAAEQSMKDNGVTEYKFMVANGVNPCDECLSMDGQVFKLSDMNVGKNAPPIHPQCHCCTAPYVDETKWQRWLDSGMKEPWEDFESGKDVDLTERRKQRLAARKASQEKDAEKALSNKGVETDISAAGNHIEEARKNLVHLNRLIDEYKNTVVSYRIEATDNAGPEGGGAYMLNGRTALYVVANRLRINKALDSLRLGANQPYALTYHEFAHGLSQSREKIDADKPFWKEIRKIRRDYLKAKNSSGWNDDWNISAYAEQDADEFLADSFAMAKLSDNPSPYALRVLEVVDKYFKKKK